MVVKYMHHEDDLVEHRTCEACFGEPNAPITGPAPCVNHVTEHFVASAPTNDQIVTCKIVIFKRMVEANRKMGLGQYKISLLSVCFSINQYEIVCTLPILDEV